VPAIQPARLKHQAAELALTFDQPATFVRGLEDLCEFYANRAYRPGVSGESRPSLLQAYNVPAPVLRQIQQEVIPLASAAPEAGLTLCQALWERPILEHRLLAAGVLGGLPVNPPAPIIACLRSWIESAPEEQILNALLQSGSAKLRQRRPESLLDLAESWLNRTQILNLQAGLRLLQSLADDPAYENLPAIFARIASLTRVLPSAVRPDLVSLLRALQRRSPSETAYFLRDNLQAPNNPDTPWVIRQVIEQFAPEIQASLRQEIRPRHAR
jgi:hypothetical protein